MLKFIAAIAFFLNIGCAGVFAPDPKILEINNFEELLDIFKNSDKNSDKNTLACFDVDYVLLHPKKPEFQMGAFTRHKKILEQKMEVLTAEERDRFLNTILSSDDMVLLDKRIPQLFRRLRLKAQVIGFVSSLTGPMTAPVNGIKSMADRKISLLKKFNFPFNTTLSNGPLIFDKIPEYLGGRPMLKEGILFTNGEMFSKADLLVLFLKKNLGKFRRVIVVDDKLDNVKEIGEAIQKNFSDIEYIGVHSTNSQQFPKNMVSAIDFENAVTKVIECSKVG